MWLFHLLHTMRKEHEEPARNPNPPRRQVSREIQEEPQLRSFRPAKSCVRETTVVEIQSATLKWLGDDSSHQDVACFYEGRRGLGPLVEEIPGDGSRVLLTFLYWGDANTRQVTLQGGPTTVEGTPLTRLGKSHLWFFSRAAPRNAQFSYSFSELRTAVIEQAEVVIEVVDLTDDLNDDLTAFGTSMLALPDSPAQPESEDPPPGVPRGNLRTFTLASVCLNGTRTYSVYAPPGYVAGSGDEFGMLVLFDGEAFAVGWVENGAGPYVPTLNILDNLIHEGRLPPMIAIFAHSGTTRDEDLPCNPAYVKFVATELLAAVRAEYVGATCRPERIIVAGSSFGGLCAAYCGLMHSETIGNVLSMSGSFWVGKGGSDWGSVVPEGCVQEGFLLSPNLPLRIFLDAGQYEESGGILVANRQLRDILRAKGYDVIYREYPGNHDYMRWRGSIVEGLLEITRDWRHSETCSLSTKRV
jgi:enterochelin esterase-like enzyme